MTEPENKDEPKQTVMYLLVNSNLSMGKGKTAAQTCHATQIIVEEILRKALTAPSAEDLLDYQHYENWIKKNAYAKIVLKATEDELRELIKTEPKCRYVIDAGRTQIAPNSLTVVGFFPRDDLAEKMKKFKLLS